MDVSRNLILKGAAGLGTAATAATGMGVAHSKNYFGIFGEWEMKIEDLAEKVGMNCVFEENNKNQGSCTLGEKINIYKWGDKEEESSVQGTPKIKFEKVKEEYRNGFKFTAESEITYSGGKKLEVNSTYEVKEIEGKWFLSKVSPLLEENKKKMLGLSTSCGFPQKGDGAYTSCNLNKDQLKAINFEGKGNEEEINFNGNVSLEIKNNNDTETFPEGYRFVFKAPKSEVTIQASPAPIVLMKNTEIDFRIKRGDIWSLERAWTIETLASKVGLDCSIWRNECSIKDGEFDAFIDNTKLENIKRSESSGGKIKFEENKEGYGQGFRFTIEGGNINLIASGVNNKKLSNNSSYEIKEVGDANEAKKWYFSKKK